ncbi:Methionine aminopeptidase 1 [Nowakowskiella sp. JEL0078]|nr:Methionine aminopeptidase 1 [Nowakowskiella sp. JEL0078]
MISCEGCGEESSNLKCPTCSKLGLSDAFFCSQDCFKSSWIIHKAKHISTTVYNPWPNYHYTGPLRPHYPLSPTRLVPELIQRPDYAMDGKPISEMRIRGSSKIENLSKADIEHMRTVCKISREVLNEGRKAIKVGVTTDEIDRVVHEACIGNHKFQFARFNSLYPFKERDSYPSPLNYHGFPKSCCTSVNEVICHGIPDKYELKDGDICNLDVSVFFNGYHGDLNETYLVGNVDEKGRKLVETTRNCLDQAIAMGIAPKIIFTSNTKVVTVRPGTLYRDIGNQIQKIAGVEGFSVVRSYCGHGIHRHFHCTPNVPHYANNKAVGTMKAGHIFTIEPMISEGVWQDRQWNDGWTVRYSKFKLINIIDSELQAVTMDGKRSAQFEETLLVTETGVEGQNQSLPGGPPGQGGKDGEKDKKKEKKKWEPPLPTRVGKKKKKGPDASTKLPPGWFTYLVTCK